MEYIVEKENKKVSLDKAKKDKISKNIVDMFEKYNNARKKVLEYARELSDEIHFKNKFVPENNKKNWKSKVKMCKMFMYFMTYKAFIWKNTYAGVNSMFEVSGETRDADNNSNKQKANLVNILEKMHYSTISDKVIDNSLIYGELISFTTWKVRKEEFRRPIEFFKALFAQDGQKLAKVVEAIKEGKNYYVDERVVYENAEVIPVNPEDFVFDTSQIDDFDSCPKIYRNWRNVDDIVNNECYELTNEEKKYLRNLVKSPDDNDLYDNTNRLDDDNKHVHGSTIEVLDYYGTYTLEDGNTLLNWHAVVIAGKYLVLFEKNKYIINPFTYGYYLKDPDTCRGISSLYSGLGLAKVQEKMLNQTVDLQSLNENKPILAPQGFFDEEEIDMYPGKIIEFDPALYSSGQISPIDFVETIYNNDIQFLGDVMSEVTGIYPNMMGSDEGSRTTATEISTKVQGQTTRLSMTLDTINQYYIIPSVENVAKLNANMKFGSEKIFFNKDNKSEEVEIDDSVRQGEYRYTYKDRNALNERFNFADMVIMAIERFAKFIPLDVRTAFIWYMEQKGVENPEKFLQQQLLIPEPVQQQLMQIPQVQQMCEMFNQQQMQASQGGSPDTQGDINKAEHFANSPTEIPM